MGVGNSKIISYKDAVGRCSPEELDRLKKGFQRLCAKSKVKNKRVDKAVFLREVIGVSIPEQLASRLFACLSKSAHSSSFFSFLSPPREPPSGPPLPGGPQGAINNQQAPLYNAGPKSISFKSFLCGVVLLLKGTVDEKARLVFEIYDLEHSGKISKESMSQVFADDIMGSYDDGTFDVLLEKIFSEADKDNDGRLSFEELKQWAKDNQHRSSLAAWIFDDRNIAETEAAKNSHTPWSNSMILDSQEEKKDGPKDIEQLLKESELSKPKVTPETKQNVTLLKKDLEPNNPIIQKGVVGLVNLGNTCFMNAAVQCLSNTALTYFFLENRHTTEINTANPIGFNGEIAKRFSSLIKQMWVDPNDDKQKSKRTKVIAPVGLRRAIAKYFPQFDNDSQQDAQEFLAYLLDGLHEGLNRIRKKPYSEFHAEEGLGDKELADCCWEFFKLRNQSVIVDLLQGQIKSSLVCEDCDYTSVTFDPFTFLSLPLPSETMRVIEVTVVFSDKEKMNVKYGVRVPKELRISQLKEEISKLCGIAPHRLIMADVAGPYIFRILQNEFGVQIIRERDMIFAYEVKVDLIESKEDEDALNMPDSLDAENVVVHVPMINRTIEKLDVYFVKPFKATPFGEAFVLSTHWTQKSKKEIYAIVWDRLQRNISAANRFGEKEQYPFSLKIVNYNGSTCGVCPWNRFCIGCPFPQDDSLASEVLKPDRRGRLKPGLSLAIDWNPDLAKSLYSMEKSKLSTEDKSLAQAYEQHNQPLDLKDCLEFFSMEELLGADALWACPKCNEFRQAKKRMSLWRVPPILVMHLKRFQRSQIGNHWSKSNKLVTFPLDANITPLNTQQGQQPPEYELVAVLNHTGTIAQGHYIAFAKNIENKKWYCFDDKRCSEISPENIVTPSAYVLFYQQKLPNITNMNELSPLPEGFQPVDVSHHNFSSCTIQ